MANSDISKFYKQIEDFKSKISTILSQLDRKQELIEINKYYDKLLMVKKINVRTPIELFYKYGVSIYAGEIVARDETFFIKQVDIIKSNGIVSDGEHKHELNHRDLLFISQIESVWDHLQPQVKTNIWNYVQIICMLSERIVGGDIMSSLIKSKNK
jgi:hypothetical protein